MDAPASSSRCVRAGLFEIDLSSGEVHKNGRKVPLQEQPFRVLAMLLERPGEIVPREELQARIWPADTYVSFDDGLNTAIRKLRVAFGDSADNPRFIETVPRRGYRVIAPIRETVGPVAHPSAGNETATGGTPVAKTPRSRLWRTSLGAGLLLTGLLVFRWFSSSPPPKILRINQLTHFGQVSPWGKLNTDGARVLFLRTEVDGWDLMQVPVSGGESQPFASPFRNARLLDLSPDRSEFLVEPFSMPGSEDQQLWMLPVVGGSPRRLSDLSGLDGAFSPDGQRIAYSKADGIYICSRNGSDSHKIVSLPAVSRELAWSPNGTALRFTLEDPKSLGTPLWEVSVDGSNLHSLLPNWSQDSRECCGQWSGDGRYFFFLSFRGEPVSGGLGSVWVLPEKGRFPWSKPGVPVRLTAAPVSFAAIRLSTDGRRLFAGAVAFERRELLRPSKHKKLFLPMFKTTDVYAANLSPKGDWLAVVQSGWTLWRSRPDGTDRTQLITQFKGTIDKPKWSPDGSRIVFQGREEGRPDNIYVVSAEGGPPQELLPSDQPRQSPDWSPDGESVAYYSPRPSKEIPGKDSGIFVLNLKTRKTTRVPQSEGMEDPRISRDGRYLAAISEDFKRLMLFDFQTRAWREIAHGQFLNHMERTPDARYFYFQDVFDKGEPVYRVHVGDWKVERVMSFESLLATGVVRCRFIGLLQDGSPMVLALRGGYDIYALDLDLP